MKVFVTCGHCQGQGKIELTGYYRETYDLLLESGGRITGAKLAKVAGCKPTAMNNRLAMLEKHGLATSERWGREQKPR